MTTTDLTTFDYAALDKRTANGLRTLAEQARACIRQSAISVWQLGEALNEAQQRLAADGQFLAWCAAELPGVSKSSIYNALNVYRQFPTVGNVEAIGLKALYLLAQPGTPGEARAEALARAEAGERITHGEAQQIVEYSRAVKAIEKAWLHTGDKQQQQMRSTALHAHRTDAVNGYGWLTRYVAVCYEARASGTCVVCGEALRDDGSCRHHEPPQCWAPVITVRDTSLERLQAEVLRHIREDNFRFATPTLPADLIAAGWSLHEDELTGWFARKASGLSVRCDQDGWPADCRSLDAAAQTLRDLGWQGIRIIDAGDGGRWAAHHPERGALAGAPSLPVLAAWARDVAQGIAPAGYTPPAELPEAESALEQALLQLTNAVAGLEQLTALDQVEHRADMLYQQIDTLTDRLNEDVSITEAQADAAQETLTDLSNRISDHLSALREKARVPLTDLAPLTEAELTELSKGGWEEERRNDDGTIAMRYCRDGWGRVETRSPAGWRVELKAVRQEQEREAQRRERNVVEEHQVQHQKAEEAAREAQSEAVEEDLKAVSDWDAVRREIEPLSEEAILAIGESLLHLARGEVEQVDIELLNDLGQALHATGCPARRTIQAVLAAITVDAERALEQRSAA